MYQNENILENKNEIVKFNKLKITEYFIAYSSLLMECLGLEPVEEMWSYKNNCEDKTQRK